MFGNKIAISLVRYAGWAYTPGARTVDLGTQFCNNAIQLYRAAMRWIGPAGRESKTLASLDLRLKDLLRTSFERNEDAEKEEPRTLSRGAYVATIGTAFVNRELFR